MQTPAFPANEVRRLMALREAAILDTPPEERFDRLTRLAQHLFGAKIALVSLVDDGRQWFKSRQGLDACETGRDISFCGHAILGDGIFEVRDARIDSRFADNPLVTGPPDIRFYAGAPLNDPEGYRLGTLCIIDTVPRLLSIAERRSLRDLADCVEAEISRVELAQQGRTLRQFKSTLDLALDCVFMFDAVSLRFFYVNDGARRQVGYSGDELMTMHPYDIKPDLSEAQFRAFIAPLLTGQTDSLTFDSEHRHKSGQLVPVEIFLQYLAPQDESARFVAIVRDITERKRVDRMKSEFVSTVSHELRTPLTSISGALGLIAGGALGEVPAKAREMIAIAHKNSQRLTHLINDLLDMEKIAAGKLHFDMQPQALMPLIAHALEANRAYGAERRIKLALVGAPTAAEVRVDSQRLMQVLSNLLSNAVKFSPEGGVVEVSVALRGQSVRTTVTDHGPGIPAAFRACIFQKFAQADASDTKQKGGTGLGLAITRELVERMGGQIGFESVDGAGASFHFDLPVVGAARPDFDREEPLPHDAPRILVVEDEPGIAHLLGDLEKMASESDEQYPRVLHVEDDCDLHRVIRAMVGERFDFVLANTLRDARARVATEQFDVVVLDLALPDGSGWDLLPQIRASQPEARVVILTGIDMTADEAGKVEAVLLKSQISPRQLLDAINARRQSDSTKRGDV